MLKKFFQGKRQEANYGWSIQQVSQIRVLYIKIKAMDFAGCEA